MADRSSNNRVNGTASSARPSNSPLRHRPLARAATIADVSGSVGQQMPRRRSSFMTNDSFDKQSLQSSTNDLLLPRLSKIGAEIQHESTHLHSAPLALALLPAVGGLVFNNGSAILTDVTLLVLASVFLNWSVRLPWDWYHSAQSIRLQDEVLQESENHLPATETIIEEEPDSIAPDEKAPASSSSPPPSPSTQRAASPRSTTPSGSMPDHAGAAAELRLHELLALLACFILPMFGAWLLHHIRSQLSRPSEGLVSDYNLSIFLLAAELRPLSHLLKMIQSRTLHLQRVVASNPNLPAALPSVETVSDLATRVDELEAHVAAHSDGGAAASSPPTKELAQQQQQQLASSVRASLQPDLDAVTRATRRYEKRATVLSLQMESRLSDIEARMRDALALAAGAERAASEQRRGGLGKLWHAFGMLAGAMADVVAWVVSLPLRSAEWGLMALLSTVGVGASGMRDLLGAKTVRVKGRGKERGAKDDRRAAKEVRRRKE